MLVEVHLLTRALDAAGIEPSVQHPRVKAPGITSGPCLRVVLGADGSVTGVEDVTPDEWPGLWTVMEGNHNSFPVVRVSESLVSLSERHAFWSRLRALDEKKDTAELADALSAVLAEEDQRELSSKSVALWKRLAELKAEELRRCGQAARGAEGAALEDLGARFQIAAKNPRDLLEQVASQAVRRLRDARLTGAEGVRLLVAGMEPGSASAPKVQLAFDLLPDTASSRGVYTDRVRREVIRVLPTELESGAASPPHPAPECALTGRAKPLQTEPFPKVRLPVLNKEFPLFSMFSEAKCNYRYGLTDSEAVPISGELARRLQDSLTHIVSQDRRGQTWEPVASGLFDKQQGRKRERMDLLVTYVDGRPEIPERIAALFGTEQEEVDRAFEVDARAICEALRAHQVQAPSSHLNLFVLRKASEGQAQVVLAERPTVDSVFRGLERWWKAAQNVPTIRLPFPPQRRGAPAELRGPRTPYLSRVVHLLSEEWLRGGARSNKVGGVSLAEVLDVFLRHDGKEQVAARRLLDLTTRRSAWLILGFQAAARTRSARGLQSFKAEQRLDILSVVALFGILLDALERNKETYMKGPPFLVGRLLALADSLHVQYCKAKREGDIPPQLIGNALVPVAAENPQAAIDRLRERMNVYHAWAMQASYADNPDKLVRWLLGQIRTVCREIAEIELPTTTDEAARAELFLGYMAREQKQSNDPPTENDEEESAR